MSIPAVPLRTTYWVVPGKLLAGAYPGDVDTDLATKKLTAFLDVGIRCFINLTEEGEISEYARPVPSYQNCLRTVIEDARLEVTSVRFPIPDRGVPSVWTMRCILDVIDRSLADDNPAFVHCWAGRGRTGTVVGCYLRRHNLASDAGVIPHLAELRHQLPTGRETSPHTPEQIRMVKSWRTGA